MKAKIIGAVLYCVNAFTVQYLVSFARGEQTDYIKLPAICVLYAVAGYIVFFFEKKFNFNSLLFLLLSLGIPFLVVLQAPAFLTDWLAEVTVAIPSFFVGFRLDRLRPVKKIIFAGILIAAVTGAALFINPLIVYKKFAKQYGRKELLNISPKYTFQDSSGRLFTDSSFKGKIVLLDYWFAGCAPCKQKMKALETLARHYNNNPEVVIAVVDAGGIDSYDRFTKEARQIPSSIICLYDSGSAVAQQLKITGFPTELIIDRQGKIRNFFVGYNNDIALIYTDKTIAKIDEMLRAL